MYFFTDDNIATILGGGLCGGITGVITLIGVRWQVIREEKRQEKDKCLGILENLKYTLDRNLEISKDNGIYYLFSFTIEDWWIFNYIKNYEIFNENIFNNDYKNLVKFQFYKEIYEMKVKLQNIEKSYNSLSINLNKKNLLFNNLFKEIKNKYEENINSKKEELKKYFEWLNIFSEFLYNLSLPLFNLIHFQDCSYFKDNVVGKLRKIKEYYGSSYFKEVDENKIDKIFNSEKNDTKEKIVKLVELINDTAIRLIQEIKSSHFSTEIEVNVDKFCSYIYFERYLLNNLIQIDIEMKDLREKINVEIEKYK
ncbi:hypothetical protein FNSP10_15940 [Fusobacterium nucleatum]|nr:hypothetical protein FNCP10_08370 [Fusobacterium nucleatum]BEP08220.1 hypothetical protein FNSP10_15940 [Fusobacterium nucleatum]